MAVVYQRPHALLDVSTHYCPGCTHGIIHKLVAQALDELDIEGRTIGIAPVGCSVMAYNYFGCDMIEAAHGRAPAIATGVKRSLPDSVVFTYQGDGDLAAIGTAETVHSATRGENITIIFVNNAIYGMTGGQMAPTTRPGQVTQTTPYGRDVSYS
ncbi:MAG: thiamine pyrophosphate-dependent enzyme, partial [Anaerotruncus massiliensis (ex Togo et al. 2019)]